MLKKILRYTLRTGTVILSLFVLAWLLVSGYILLNKPSLLRKARTELNKQLAGEVSIKDMDISFFRHFPYITLQLSHVVIRDSLWQQHHHDLLKAANVYVGFSLFRSIFSGRARVEKVFVEQGSIYLFTDSTGYSNTSLLRARSTGGKEKEDRPPDISFSALRFVMERPDQHKLFDLDVRQLDCTIEKDNRTLLLRVNTAMRVNNFAFHTEKGSFLKDKELAGRFSLQFNTASRILQGSHVELQLDGHPFLFSGRFFPDVNPDPFTLTIQTFGIPYRKVTALLTPLLQQKLNQYDIDKPISLNVSLDAGSADDRTPQITVWIDLRQSTVTTPAGRFEAASFDGSFTNEWVHGRKREDENSGLRLIHFTGNWENIPLRSDMIAITNLKHPLLGCDLHSLFGFRRFNELFGSGSVQFLKGSCAVDLLYKGPISEKDSTVASINGNVDIDTAAISYIPHRLLLEDCKGRLRFKDQDLFIDHLEAHTGSSAIYVKGIVRNLVTLINKNPESIGMELVLSSPHLDLRDLSPLAGRPLEPAPLKNGKSRFARIASRLDRFLNDGKVHLQLQAADIKYDKFSGAHARADLLFSGNEIRLNTMQVGQGGGSLTLSGNLRLENAGAGNPVTLQSHMEQVDLPWLFAAFNNFGQKALLDKNLKGKLEADIRMNGLLTDKAEMVQNSLKGTVNFSIKGGQLLDFEPIQKIQETVLKKRDLSEVRFSELKGRLDVDSTAITLHRMEIQSTALTFFVEGLYDLKKGADLGLQVPLSNLKNRSQDTAPPNQGTHNKTGISLRLRAKTGEDGKLKIRWDPFKKALRKGRTEKNNRP